MLSASPVPPKKASGFAAHARFSYVPRVDSKTHRRGPADTSMGRLAMLLGVSLLLHAPFTPWAALFGLLGMWKSPVEDVESPPITGIPIDIIEEEAPPAPATNPEPAAATGDPGPATDPQSAAPPKKKPDPTKIADAGAPDAESLDAEAADAGTDAGSVGTDAGNDAPRDAGPQSESDAGPADAGPAPLKDPTLVAGVARVADPNANVRITLYNEKIRETPLGERVGPLLRSLYQWRDFFGPTGVDPIRDIDQIYVVGPQLRDSSNVVAILRHHLPAARMHTAVDQLVRSDKLGGRWLDASVPAASAHADGAERRFVLANAQTVIVTPPSAYDSALAGAKVMRLVASKGPEAAMIYLATPWRAFMGLPVQVPQTIKWARVRITPTADGGATADIDAEDESPEAASNDAAYLTKAGNAMTQLSLGTIGSMFGISPHRFVERIAFSADGKTIRGEVHITAAQLSDALDMAGAMLSDRERRRQQRATPAPSASSPR